MTHVQLDISATTREETIRWRDFFYQWGAISPNSDALDEQEERIEQEEGGYHLLMQVEKEKLVKSFRNAIENKVHWEKFHGKRTRQEIHRQIEIAAQRRFDLIPTLDFRKRVCDEEDEA